MRHIFFIDPYTLPINPKMDYQKIIDRHYPLSPLRDTLMIHSRAVAGMALDIARRRSLDVDLAFVEEAAMLHDIGIFLTDAPSIHCHGSLPYICHGVEGARLMREAGFPRHALVCERHTGAGLTVDDIMSQHLPLPLRDMTPHSLEEKLICYADKFFSKSGELAAPKPIDKVIRQMEAHGPDTLRRFLELHDLFFKLN